MHSFSPKARRGSNKGGFILPFVERGVKQRRGEIVVRRGNTASWHVLSWVDENGRDCVVFYDRLSRGPTRVSSDDVFRPVARGGHSICLRLGRSSEPSEWLWERLWPNSDLSRFVEIKLLIIQELLLATLFCSEKVDY